MDRKDKDHHWFHLFAVRDRICDQTLRDDSPTAEVSTLQLQTFLPSAEDCQKLQMEFKILIGRVLVKNITFFSQFQENVPDHIKHRHSADMTKKSEIVRLRHNCTICIITSFAGSPWCFNQV